MRLEWARLSDEHKDNVRQYRGRKPMLSRECPFCSDDLSSCDCSFAQFQTLACLFTQEPMTCLECSRGLGSIPEFSYFWDSHLTLQADAQVTSSVAEAKLPEKSDYMSAQTVQFLDEHKGVAVGFSSVMDNVELNDNTPNVDLGDFLSRPVRIANFSWLETDTRDTRHVYDPWYLFFNDSRIKNKLNNFAFIQCDLKVKVMINASPFYYGALLVSYQPLQNFTASTIIDDVALLRHYIPYSQRPHLWIYPQNNEGGEMTLPFIWPKNKVAITSAQDFHDLGQLTFTNFTTLKSANGVVGSGVTVQVYAWAENVVVSGPTVGLALQADDEYGNGVVSKPASAIAAIAGKLSSVPIIGKFATATQIGASAVSRVASLFGFTNVPVLDDSKPYRPNAFPALSNVDIGYPVEKLTIDSKNELSIDPSVIGLSSTDELCISHLVRRESLLTSFGWSTTNNVDDILFTSLVTPWMFDSTGTTNMTIYPTPMAYVANCFQHWRGDVIFRFRFICSQYHKGRLRLTYDPSGVVGNNITVDSTSSSVTHTQIVDLGKDSDVEIRVPYQQALAWLRLNTSFSNANVPFDLTLTPPFNYNPLNHNGTLTARVLTDLTAPVGLSDITVIVFVRGADNLEFANPVTPGTTFSPFVLQSDDSVVARVDTQSIVAGAQINSPADHRYLVNWGEAIGSLRQLLRRSVLSYVDVLPNNTTNDFAIYKRTMSKFPYYYGYDPGGIHSAKGTILPLLNFPFNYVQNGFFHWITPAFVGVRGSMMWHINIDNPKQLSNLRVYRRPANGATAASALTVANRGTVSGDSRFYMINTDAGCGGQSITNQFTQSGLSVVMPNYVPYKFMSTQPSKTTAPTSADGGNNDGMQIEANFAPSNTTDTKTAKIWYNYGIGTDFNLFFFLNVPSYQIISTVPASN